VVVILLFGLMQSGLLILLGNYFAIEGKVVSVTRLSDHERTALVRLNWGPLIEASIPAACPVFPGQVATVYFTGPLVGSKPAFQLWESRDKT